MSDATKTLFWAYPSPREARIPTEEESYQAGFKCGLEWPDAWEAHGQPGGPWVHTGRKGVGDPYAEHAWATRRNNVAWRKGWDEGHVKKLASRSSEVARGT